MKMRGKGKEWKVWEMIEEGEACKSCLCYMEGR